MAKTEQAYKVKSDTTFPMVLRRVVNIEGVEIEEVAGQSYDAGSYLFAEDLTERDRERASNGDLDYLLEAVDRQEAEDAMAVDNTNLRIPEHEMERYVALAAGDRVVERDQIIDLRSAGAQAAAAAMADAKSAGLDERPQITEQPSFVEVNSITEEEPVVPVKSSDPVDEAELEESGVEMPPGLPVGPTLAKAEGADPDEVDKSTKKSARKKPGSSSASSSSSSSGSGSSQ